MANNTFNNLPQVLNKSDPRYFIWAIVFLIVSGVSLVSYIMITGIYEDQQLIDSTMSIPSSIRK